MRNQLLFLILAFMVLTATPSIGQLFQPVKLNQFTGDQISGMPSTYTNGILIQAMQAGDYDNDGDLDLAIRATDNDTGTPFATLYVNQSTPGNFIIQQSAFDFSLASKMYGWADLNNDGFVDLIGANGNLAVVYLNNAGLSFTFQNLFNSASPIDKLDWADFDGDGDIDFLCTEGVYRHNADGSYSLFKSLFCSDCKFVDYDGDSDFDLTNGDVIYSYQNGNYVQTHDLLSSPGASISLPEVVFQDINGDGKPDFVTSYREEPFSGGGPPPGNKGSEYWSNNNNQYSRVSSFQAINGFPFAISDPVDLDHNGKLDIIYLSAAPSPFNSQIYRVYEIGGTPSFQLLDQFNTGFINTTAYAVGDFDNDGSVDFISAGDGSGLPYFPGSGVFAYFFRNLASVNNQSPSVPNQLTQFSAGDETTLTWQQATDDITPTNSLQYNVYVRRGVDTVFSSNSLASGRRKITENGNVGSKNNIRFKDLPQGIYHWSVQSMDASYRTSSFASENSFVIETGETPINKVDGTAVKAVTDFATGNYVLAIVQNNKIVFRQVDSNAQHIKSVTTTIETSDYEMTLPASSNEIMLVWVDMTGTWAQAFDKNSLQQTTPKQLISSANDFNEIAIAYNSVENNFVALMRRYFDVGGTFPDSRVEASLFKEENQQITVIDEQLLVTTTNSGSNFRVIDNVNIGYHEDKNVYVISWANYEYWDIGQICCTGPSTTVRAQLLGSNLGLLGTPLTVNGNTSFQTEIVKMQSGRDNKLLLVWGGIYVLFPSYYKAINGAELTVDGTVANPTLTAEELASGISFVRQGVPNTGSETPVLAFNSRRNEFAIAWKSLYDNGNIRYQRYDVVDKRLVLSEEALFSDKFFPLALTFNPKANQFLLSHRPEFSTSNIFYSRFNVSKDPFPLVAGASALQAYAGDTIVVSGGFFSKTPALNTVMFGNISATVTDTYKNGAQLEVIIPPGLGRTPIPITVSFDDQSTASTFLFENLTLQSVTAVDLSEGERGEVVTITGDKFATDPAQVTVKFGNTTTVANDIVSLTSTEIKVKVPSAALRGTGPLSVIIQGQEVTAPSPFRVIVPPSITSVSAPEGFISCKSITIQGQDFSANPNDLLIKFGETPALTTDIVSSTSNAIIVNLPFGAQGTAPISVTTDDRTASSTAQTFQLGAAISPTSPIPAKSITLTSRSDDAVAVQLRVLNQCSVSEVRLWTKGISGGQSDWTSEVLTLESNRADKNISESAFTDPIGLNVAFEIDDVSGIKVYSDTFFIQKNYTELDSTNNVPSLTFGGDVSNYNIISVPYELAPNNIPSVFKDLVNKYGSDSSKWRLFHYLNSDSRTGYIENTRGLDKIEPGKGYWMIIRYPQDIFIDGAKAVDVSAGPFEITLRPGWNQIGNPYNFAISWLDVLAFNNNPPDLEGLKVFTNGTLENGTTLAQYQGGFVRNNSPGTIVLRIPYLRNASLGGGRKASRSRNTEIDADDWYMPLELSTRTLTNKTIGIGMHPEAKIGWDKYDENRMPKFFNQLDVAFTDNIVSSTVPTNSFYEWSFEVSNATQEKVLKLSWHSAEFGVNDRQAFLYDVAQEKVIDMRSTNSYSFEYPSSKKFRLLYGNEKEIASKLAPEQNLLGRAFPNPFRGEVIIPFTVIEPMSVRLVIYNLLGQPIKTLVKDKLNAGFHKASWTGEDQLGVQVGSGTYIYQIEYQSGANSRRQAGRIIKQ